MDPLKETIRVAAKVCADNREVALAIHDTAEAWPAGVEEQARHTMALSEQMLAALVRLYLRTL